MTAPHGQAKVRQTRRTEPTPVGVEVRHPQRFDLPNCLYVLVDVTAEQARTLAETATALAVARAPKLSGTSARSFRPYWGARFFGVRWVHPYVWFQESGTQPYTMTRLAGKTIPMWLDDPLGTLRADNPKAQTRRTISGRTQVLIFRRAARVGQRKTVRRRVAGQEMDVSVPAAYPGAPGRIALRSQSGQVHSGNLGVRWYSPGLAPRGFVRHSVLDVAESNGLGRPEPYTIRT